MDPRLTEKQSRLLSYIREYTAAQGYPPSLREMANYLDIRALSTVHQHVKALKVKGLLKQAPDRQRNLKVQGLPKLVRVPLVGTITAGVPIEPIEDPDPFYVSTDLVKRPSNHYALRVRGNSMIDDGIYDGDVVVVRHQNHIDYAGQTIVAIINQEATLKRFGGIDASGWIKLVPRNPNLRPFSVDPESFEVRGVMVGLIRSE
jgi:repressor LexA